MRSHQFGDNTGLAKLQPEAIIIRLHSYIRNRFGKGVTPKKGRWARARNARLLASKPWKRCF